MKLTNVGLIFNFKQVVVIFYIHIILNIIYMWIKILYTKLLIYLINEKKFTIRIHEIQEIHHRLYVSLYIKHELYFLK